MSVVNKCAELISKLAGLTIEVSLLGRGRTCLKKPGLKDLAKDLGVSVKARMTKADLWDAILLTEHGEELAEYIAGIATEKSLVGPESMESVVELSRKRDDEDMMNTGVNIRHQSFIEPVMRDHQGLETLLYTRDPRNPVSNIEVGHLEELYIERDELYGPFSKAKDFYMSIYAERKRLLGDAFLAQKNKKIATRDLEDLIRNYWEKNLEPNISSEVFNSCTRRKEYIDKNGKKHVWDEDLIQALAIGFDTFISSYGSGKGWEIVRRNSNDDFEVILYLRPSFKMECQQKVDLSWREANATSNKEITARMKEMSEILKESFIGETFGTFMIGYEEYLEDLRNQARSEWLGNRIKMLQFTKMQKHNVFVHLVNKKRKELKPLREQAKKDMSSEFNEATKALCLGKYYAHVAYNVVLEKSLEAIEANKAKIDAVNRATKNMYYSELQWFSPTPQADAPGRWDSSSYEVLGELYDMEKEDEISAAFWDMIRGKSNPKNKNNNKEKIAMLNGCTPVGNQKVVFVDPAIAWDTIKQLEEEEAQANRPENAPIPEELPEEAFQFFETATDEELFQAMGIE